VQISRSGLLALLFVYFVWGSTFLAIRIAIRGDHSFAPFMLAAFRTGGAGLVLLLVALACGHSLRVGWKPFAWLAFTGLLFWIGGHALVIWAEQRVDSGLAALIFASVPLWAVLLECWRKNDWQAKKLLPVLVGFLGVSLVLPLDGSSLGGGLWIDGAALVLSAFFWALGSVLGDGPARHLPLALTGGYQLLSASLVSFLIALLAGESRVIPGGEALLAGCYLLFVGTVLAFLAYAHTLRVLPVNLLMSFAYVNPVVALVLGALVMDEKLGVRSFAGMAIVLGSVAWIFLAPGVRRST
jgi:drug/metabolite transporter (DMT)-like permease